MEYKVTLCLTEEICVSAESRMEALHKARDKAEHDVAWDEWDIEELDEEELDEDE